LAMGGDKGKGKWGVMMPGKGDWAGKGWGKGATPAEWTTADYMVPGFAEALAESLAPHTANEADAADLELKIGQKFVKAAKKFNNDERRDTHGTPCTAQALVEEFVDAAMNSVAGTMYDRAWWPEANFTGPLLALALFTFDGAKIFRRTVGPMIEKYVELGIFRYREEERVGRVMSDALDAAGVRDSHKKKALKHLSTAYDEQHAKAPYGTVAAETPEMGHLKAFLKGWMHDFIGRAWDVLEHGIGQGDGSSRDEKVLFVTVLFQALADGKDPGLPYDLTYAVGEVPASPWSYVAEAAETVFTEMDSPPMKKPKMGPFGAFTAPW